MKKIISNISRRKWFIYFLFMALSFNSVEAYTVSTKITPPFGGTSYTLKQFIVDILKVVTDIGVPIIVLAIVYSGFLFVKAQGNETELTKAKQAFFWTVVGSVVIFGAWVVAEVLSGTIAQISTS